MAKNLKGLGVALITPFTSDKKIDFDTLEFLINYQIKNGTDYLVVLGTTGETATLADDERYEILNFVLKKTKGEIGLVAGYGGNDTNHVLKAFNDFDPSNFDAILSVAPYYNKPNQEGLYQHYAAIANACPVPIILYNVPGRTSCNISNETTLRLANDFENIVAIKDATGNIMQSMDLISKCPEGFSVISGDDNLTLPFISCGMTGLISVMANAYPKTSKKIVDLALNGNFDEARELHYNLLNFMKLIFEEGNPTGVKTAMNLKPDINLDDSFRLPIVKASSQLKQKIANEIETLKVKGIVN